MAYNSSTCIVVVCHHLYAMKVLLADVGLGDHISASECRSTVRL